MYGIGLDCLIVHAILYKQFLSFKDNYLKSQMAILGSILRGIKLEFYLHVHNMYYRIAGNIGECFNLANWRF